MFLASVTFAELASPSPFSPRIVTYPHATHETPDKMLINDGTAVSTSSILLMPYEASHVTTYHEWMKDPDIQEATASEPLSIEEEYAMQKSWRSDHDKLTFIACKPLAGGAMDPVTIGTSDHADRMIGDVNLFLSAADEDDEGCIGELELMIAPVAARRQGYGRATILAFLNYIEAHLEQILLEYRAGAPGKMKLLQLKVKIGSRNVKSINLFESIGFVKVQEGPNYFGEIELIFEGFLGKERVRGLLEKYGVEEYREVEYRGPGT
ncbi:N-acetyltransferase 9-like protein [Phlyctema vagabunda]|uniref:N-acetyltransferase 9-like protein n=1 Tax=Phlyctema vagabunda TaxID=108571 RepID=A0ABR4PY40_9HELO